MSGLDGQGGAEQARAGDGVQRPLRFRFPPRLTRSVRLQMCPHQRGKPLW